MGSGVALAIREAFPEAYEDYRNRYYYSKLGQPIITHTKDKIIGNLITQDRYGYDGEVYASEHAISLALDTFCFYYKSYNKIGIDGRIVPIASPKIGTGRGGLDWETKVKPIYENISNYHDIDFYIYEIDDEFNKRDS
jgi:O-acetyl-ADP-ribose deacetylase (regulator of RNase III)